jgi:uncharacterized spore protein YtfJ
MSDESASASPEPQQSSSRSGRSPIEKAIWCIIALVIFGLGLELYAKTSYENTMAAIDDVFNKPVPEPQHLSDIQKLISGLTRYGSPVQSKKQSQEDVKVTWLSPTNKYSFTLVLEKGGNDPIVAWYKMGAENWVTDPHLGPTEEIPADQGMSPMDMANMPMGGGGGGPPGDPTAAGRQGGGGGGGGGRARRPRGLVGILTEESVLAELELTSEQKEKVDELANAPQMDFRAIMEASPEQRAEMQETARASTEASVNSPLKN